MAREGFYNENEYRDYPFQTRVSPLEIVPCPEVSESSFSSLSTESVSSSSSVAEQPLVDLPHEAIVDFGAIMAIDSRYDHTKHCVWLSRISRYGDVLVYEFRTNTPGASGESLRFFREVTDTEFKQQWAGSTPLSDPDPLPGSPSSSSSSSASSQSQSLSQPSESSASSESMCPAEFDCIVEPKWEGFLVTGLFDALGSLVNDGEHLAFPSGLWVVEPARIQSLVNTYVRTINLANRARVLATPADDCLSGSSEPLPEQDTNFVINQVCMDGDLAFKEGFNCTIRQVSIENKLVFSGDVGGGAGRACEEVPITRCEEADGLLGGGPTCGETIRQINGIGGRNFRIEAGPGLFVGEHPDFSSTLTISATLGGLADCVGAELPSSSYSSVSSSVSSESLDSSAGSSESGVPSESSSESSQSSATSESSQSSATSESSSEGGGIPEGARITEDDYRVTEDDYRVVTDP